MEAGSDNTVLALDLGGTWLKMAEVDRSGKVLWVERVAAARDYERDIDALRHMAERRSSAVAAAGIAAPGPLNCHTGEIILAENLNWHHVFPAHDLSDALNVPAIVENDADAAALGEWTYGAGRGSQVLVFYIIGTGVGSGVVEGGRIYHGAFDPEFGHQIVEADSPRTCLYGHHGCLEAMISGSALERAYGSIMAVPDEVWEEVIPRYLGQALANATLFLSPDTIVLGGGVVDHHREIVPPALREMHLMLNDFVAPPRIRISELGSAVGLLGAAALAWSIARGTEGAPASERA
jgi:glucokinase